MRKFGAEIRERIRLRLSKGRMVVSSMPEAMTQDAKGLQSSNIYQSAKECPLEVMIEVMCNGNYNALAKNGTDNPELLQDAWLTIYSEYCGIAGDSSVKTMIATTAKSLALQARIESIAAMLNHAIICRSEELCAELTKEGYPLDFKAARAEYERQILAGQSKLKSEVMRLEQLQADAPKQKGSKKITEEDFYTALFEIGKAQTRNAQVSDYTVYTYAVALKQLQRHLEAMTPKKKNNGR